MEIAKLAVGAYLVLTHVINLIAGGAAPAPTPTTYRVCYQARLGEGTLYCPSDFTAFSMPEPDPHWAVRP